MWPECEWPELELTFQILIGGECVSVCFISEKKSLISALYWCPDLAHMSSFNLYTPYRIKQFYSIHHLFLSTFNYIDVYNSQERVHSQIILYQCHLLIPINIILMFIFSFVLIFKNF